MREFLDDNLHLLALIAVVLGVLITLMVFAEVKTKYAFPATQCSETLTGRMHAKQHDAGQGAQITGKEWMIVCARSEWR